MVSLPLTGFPGKPSDPLQVYVAGWILYMLMWVIVISAAIRQIISQVDYNLSQVCCVLFSISYCLQLKMYKAGSKETYLRVITGYLFSPVIISTETWIPVSNHKFSIFLVKFCSLHINAVSSSVLQLGAFVRSLKIWKLQEERGLDLAENVPAPYNVSDIIIAFTGLDDTVCVN